MERDQVGSAHGPRHSKPQVLQRAAGQTQGRDRREQRDSLCPTAGSVCRCYLLRGQQPKLLKTERQRLQRVESQRAPTLVRDPGRRCTPLGQLPRTATMACTNGTTVAQRKLRSIVWALTAQNKESPGVEGPARQVLHARRRRLRLGARVRNSTGCSASTACLHPAVSLPIASHLAYNLPRAKRPRREVLFCADAPAADEARPHSPPHR
jgi:hypothetical protein